LTVSRSAEDPAEPGRERDLGARAPERVIALLAFAAAVALVLLYGLRGSGSYDLGTYEQHGLVVWWLVAVGFALGLLPRTRPARPVLTLIAVLAAYGVWTALSLTWTSSSELTFAEIARVLGYLGLVVLVSSVLDRRTWRPAAAGLAFGGLVICVVAVGSRLTPAVFGHDQVDTILHTDRLSVPFGYWNSVGAWGAMCTAIGLAWSSHDRVHFRRAVALGLVPLAALTTYLTYSRAGVGGTVLAVLAVLALSRNRVTALIHAAVAAAATGLLIAAVRSAHAIEYGTGTAGAGKVLLALLVGIGASAVVALLTGVGHVDRLRVPRQFARVAAIVATVVVVVAAVVSGPHLAHKAWDSFKRAPTAQASTNPTARLTSLSGNRYQLWKVMLTAFDHHPLDGIGAGTTEFWWNEHATNSEFVRDAHNIWIQNLAELGLPGLLLIAAVAASALWVGIAVRRRVKRSASVGIATGFLAAFIVYLLHASVDWMWESTAVTVLALAGIATLGVRLAGPRPALRIGIRLAVVAFAVVAGAVELPGLLNGAALQRSESAARAGQLSSALGWAQQALDAEPWSASAYQQLGLVLESAGELRPAAADLHDAIDREPLNYDHWLILARIDAELGQLGPAVRAYDRARQLRPRSNVFAAGSDSVER
jgi:hypothetical protein